MTSRSIICSCSRIEKILTIVSISLLLIVLVASSLVKADAALAANNSSKNDRLIFHHPHHQQHNHNHRNNQHRHQRQKSAGVSGSTSVARSMRNSNFKVTALVEKSVTLTCSIELDDKEFSKTGNYKIIWSREIENGRDYEPLALDDTRLVSDGRINPTRLVINKPSNDQIQWNLVINNLKLSDSNNYICQLNQRPYDVYWLKKFSLNVYEPASFVDEIHSNETNPAVEYENSIFVKSINELDDFKLRCNSKGRPKPTVTWFLRYQNGTQIQLHIDNNEIVIKSIKKSSKIDRVECQISNGYGATVTRSFKINIRHRPYMHTKPKVYNVPARTPHIKLNCSVNGNPLPQVQWYFLPNEILKTKLLDANRAVNSKLAAAINASGSSSNRFGLDEIELSEEWKPLNQVASYAFKLVTNTVSPTQSSLEDPHYHDDSSSKNSSSYSIVKLPLSKYQIFERRNVNHVGSTLEIKLINEKDFGLYRCLAFNELGNHSVDFRIQELNHEPVNSDRMRSLLNREREKAASSNSKNGGGHNSNDRNGNYAEDSYANGNEESDEDDIRESTYYYDRSGASSTFLRLSFRTNMGVCLSALLLSYVLLYATY